MKKQLLLTMGLATILAVGCKKEDDTPEAAPSASQPSAQMFNNPGDADGVLVAIETYTTQEIPGFGTTQIAFGTAVAVFPQTDGSFAAAGAISVEGEALTKNDNNSYTHIPSQTNPTGISFDGTINWNVAGAGSIPGFERNVSNTIPSIGDLKAGGEVSTGGEFTLEVDLDNSDTDLNTADSLYFGVYGPEGQLLVSQTINGGASYTFSADEMASVGKGSGFVQVSGVDFAQNAIVSNQKMYFINQGVMTKSVTFN